MTDGETADALESTQGALGTSVLALIISEKRSLKPLALDGVAPTAKNIADGSYPYFKSLYALARTNPTGPAEDFMGFLRSPSARKILAELGYWVGEGVL
jgi:phosphate transport system substrate-binding protein